MKIADIYVRITGYLIQEIIIHQWRINSQYFMLAHIFPKIIIYTYKREIFLTFMLADGFYITLPLEWVNVEEISKIQCHLYTSKTPLHKSKLQEIFPTYMLVSLWIINSLVPDVQMEDIANIICQLFHYFIQQYHDENRRNLC